MLILPFSRWRPKHLAQCLDHRTDDQNVSTVGKSDKLSASLASYHVVIFCLFWESSYKVLESDHEYLGQS